jgi:hypothetical protein
VIKVNAMKRFGFAGLLLVFVLAMPVHAMRTPVKEAAGSSAAEEHGAELAIDGSIFTYFSTEAQSEAAAEQWLQLDFGFVQHGVNRVRMYPREGGEGFPIAFSILHSRDGERWEEAPGGRRGRMGDPDWRPVVVNLDGPVDARYLRVRAEQLPAGEDGRYAMQIAQIAVEQARDDEPDRRVAPVEVQATRNADETYRLVNNSLADGWPAMGEESLTLVYAKRYLFTGVVLWPREGEEIGRFDLEVETSVDGETFESALRTAGEDHSDGPLRFSFEPVNARMLRITFNVPMELGQVTAEVGAPFLSDMPGNFDRIWNELWLQFGSQADGRNVPGPRYGHANWFEWTTRKIMWADEPAYREGMKRQVRDYPINPEGYVWSWNTNIRWPAGGAYHFAGQAKYMMGVYRIAMWDGPEFLAVVDEVKRNDIPTTIEWRDRRRPDLAEPGDRLGQSFEMDRPFRGVGGQFPTYRTRDSSMTLRLYRDGPGGEEVARRRAENVADNSFVFVEVEEALPPGRYYLEMSEVEGTIAWGTMEEDTNPTGRAYRDGEPLEKGDRALRVQLAEQDPFKTYASQGKTQWEKVVMAMHYMERELGGSEGLLIIDNGENDGTRHGEPSNYWDNLNMGYKEPYTNLYFVAACSAMSELAQVRGEAEMAEHYRELAQLARRRYNETFWDDEKGRYVSTIDINGEVWDFGLTFLNMEAMAYGIPEPEQAEQILQWLDGGRIIEGDRSGGADIYHFRIAPRANTLAIEDMGEPFWWNSIAGAINPDGNAKYGEHLENGGCIFYTTFYDIMARHRYRGIDDAFGRMRTIVDEYAVDELIRKPANHVGANWRMGVTSPFPESGLVPTAFLFAIMGVDATADGLVIAPDLPREMNEAQVRRLYFRGRLYDIHVTGDGITLRSHSDEAHKLPLVFAGLVPGAPYELTVEGEDELLKIGADADADGRLRRMISLPAHGTVYLVPSQ